MVEQPSLLRRLRFAAREIEWSALGVGRGRCPLCGGRSFVRLSRDLLGTRCIACTASPISMAIGAVLAERVPDFADRRICELSSRGPFFAFLARSVAGGTGELTCSEYFDDSEPGAFVDGVQCQDVQQLTYEDGRFDVCTSTEVFEHVPDDAAGFAELHRVLAPRGHLLLTVPLTGSPETVERAVLEQGAVRHLLAPTYHDDQIRGAGRVLVYRDYGRDVTQRLEHAGFEDAEIVEVPDPAGLGAVASVVVARSSARSG